MTCGECVGFAKEILKDKKLCNSAGILVSSSKCPAFVPDTNALSELIDSKGTFNMLAELMHNIPDNKLRLIGAFFMREHLTRNNGFHMGQKVYVRYRGMIGSNYLSNFMSAYIMYADSTMLRVTSKDGKCCMTFSGNACSAVIDNTTFQKMKAKMVAAGRYTDPDASRLVAKRIRCEEEYALGIADLADKMDIPTIDRVFRENKIKKSKTTGPNDLIAIVNAIESGFEVKSTRSSKKASVEKTTKSRSTPNGIYSVEVNG